nr:hypothetical protein [Desulfobacula sp.]
MSYPAELDIKTSNTPEAFPVGLVIGVAVRIKASVKSNEGTLSVPDIPSLIAHAKNKEGSINAEIEVIGIKNNTILKLPRFQGEINKDTLGTILQNIATINAEIDNIETEIIPQIIGVDINTLPKNVELDDVVIAIRKWKMDSIRKGKSLINELSLINQSTESTILSAGRLKASHQTKRA